ncbi:MAG TPA: OsmC family protein [Gemmatimonadales bacterium]|nr:OsmC family protein [Gemmatimonadales bacterium]
MAGKTANVSVRWRTQLVFEGSGTGQPSIVVDGDTQVATSPVQLLLVACASCTGADIVEILEKMRVVLRTLEIEAEGTRREDYPRRFTAIHFRFRVGGDGVDEAKMRRAVDLSLEKYCSVMASLAPDIRVTYDLTIA